MNFNDFLMFQKQFLVPNSLKIDKKEESKFVYRFWSIFGRFWSRFGVDLGVRNGRKNDVEEIRQGRKKNVSNGSAYKPVMT